MTETEEVGSGSTTSESPLEEPIKPSQEVETSLETEMTEVTSSKNDNLKKAAASLLLGRRNLLIKDLPLALVSLGECCSIYAELLGPFATESGEAHFYYGKALLESARNELSIVPEGTAIPTADEESSEDDEEAEDGNEDKMETDGDGNGEVVDPPAAEDDLTDASPSNEVEADKMIQTESIEPASPSLVNDAQPSTSSGPSNNLDTTDPTETPLAEEEEPSNLELAWEVLETAKLSYRLQVDTKLKETEGDDEIRKKDLVTLKRRLADIHLLLGDVATESEMYAQAEEEYETALDILRSSQPGDSREIAQCYFQLGIACSFHKKFKDAIEHFENSLSLIKTRIGNLEKTKTSIENGESAKDTVNNDEVVADPSENEKEIEELKCLIPELEEKINDTIDAQNDTQKTNEEDEIEKEKLLGNSPNKTKNPTTVNNISHLVRKKKRLVDTEATEGNATTLEPPTKKQCLANGVSSTNITSEVNANVLTTIAEPTTNGTNNSDDPNTTTTANGTALPEKITDACAVQETKSELKAD